MKDEDLSPLEGDEPRFEIVGRVRLRLDLPPEDRPERRMDDQEDEDDVEAG